MFYKLTIYNARAHPLFYSLNLLFGDVCSDYIIDTRD